MSMGSWIKAHRKQVITHLSVIAAFVLLTIFVFEPLFDRLEEISGEAKIQQIQLPAETNNIRYVIESMSTEGHTGVEIKGWAFVEGQDSENRELYIVLKSLHRTYVFDSQVMLRQQLTQNFTELCVNVEYSGFTTIIPASKISNGEYTVGIYIREGDIEALQYIDKEIVKSKDVVETKTTYRDLRRGKATPVDRS